MHALVLPIWILPAPPRPGRQVLVIASIGVTEVQVQQIAAMDRPALVQAIRTMECPFPIDLTPQYLDGLNLEELRHIYLALRMHARQRPNPTA